MSHYVTLQAHRLIWVDDPKTSKLARPTCWQARLQDRSSGTDEPRRCFHISLLTVRWNAHPDRFMKQGIPSRNSLFGSWFMLVYGKSYRKHWEIFTAKSPEAAPQDWATPTPWGLWCPSHGPEGSNGQVGCPKWWRFWSWIMGIFGHLIFKPRRLCHWNPLDLLYQGEGLDWEASTAKICPCNCAVEDV